MIEKLIVPSETWVKINEIIDSVNLLITNVAHLYEPCISKTVRVHNVDEYYREDKTFDKLGRVRESLDELEAEIRKGSI